MITVNDKNIQLIAAAQLTFKEREQLVLELLVDNVPIKNIAKLIDCESNFVETIAKTAIENYVPPWIK